VAGKIIAGKAPEDIDYNEFCMAVTAPYRSVVDRDSLEREQALGELNAFLETELLGGDDDTSCGDVELF